MRHYNMAVLRTGATVGRSFRKHTTAYSFQDPLLAKILNCLIRLRLVGVVWASG